ncbi:hypothetical protein ABIA69_001686 [Lysinibacillus parviboronicapiens]|uniref:DNA/RNA non-specific endonuclease n=1 Tax=Lysinibacillus parviboronicapiens TaxID=436516 RepID=A0ABV2PHX0_9BACI
MAKKGKGFFGSIGSFLGSIPAVGKVKNAAKSVKKKIKNTKKKLKKAIKKAKKKLKKKLKKKIGKVFTKARKLKNNLSKSKMVKKFKRAAKKVALATKKVASKAKSAAKAATKAVKQTAKKVATAVKSVDIKQAISTAVDFIPIVGNVKSAYEAIVGKDPFTGQKLAPWERAVAAAGIIGGPVVKGAKHAAKIGGAAVSGIAKAGKKGVPTKVPAKPPAKPNPTSSKKAATPSPKSNPTSSKKATPPPKSNPTSGNKVAAAALPKKTNPTGGTKKVTTPPKKPNPKDTVQPKVAYKEPPKSNSQVNSLPKAVGMETTPKSIAKIPTPKAASKSEAQVISFPKAVGESGSTPRPTPKNNPMPSAKSGETKGDITKTSAHEEVIYGEHFTKNGRKKVLKPNVEYKSPDGYTYRTDSNGRITECEGTLTLGTADRNPYAQRTVGGKDRLPDDDGGHLIGAQFKGPKDIDNLVPQNSQINRSGGEWFNMETEWANALKETPPKKVTVQIEPIYSGNSMRPDSFEVTYQIGSKKEVTRTILNQSGG